MRLFYQVWSEEGGEFVGLCSDFPSLRFLAPSPNAALTGIINLVRSIEADT